MTVIVGLSGGIGSGKSTVSAMLEKLGATLVDADALVHEMQSPGTPMLAAMAEAFGDHVIRTDGSLDREAVAAIVFQDETARVKLGSIVHGPVIAEMIRRAVAARDEGVPMVVLDIPLLFEGAKSGRGSGAIMDFDATIAVWVPRDVQLARTMARDGCTRDAAEQRIAAQMSIDEKRDMADHVIDNSGSIDETERQVATLYAELLASARS